MEKRGCTQNRRELLREAAGIEPGNRDVQIKLAWLLTRTNSVEEARPAVVRCRELDPRNEQAPLFVRAFGPPRKQACRSGTGNFGSSSPPARSCRMCDTPVIPNWRIFSIKRVDLTRRWRGWKKGKAWPGRPSTSKQSASRFTSSTKEKFAAQFRSRKIFWPPGANHFRRASAMP